MRMFRSMAVLMPAFSLYITDDRRAFVKAEAERLSISEAKFIALLIDSYRRKARAQLAVVGKDMVAWTPPLSVEEAKRSRDQASAVHLGLLVYLLPEGVTVAQGAPVPVDATVLEE